ncbi:MAG: DNA gyrase inhibitor YacG [Hyphomicrobium sp.]|nr:DNA gyrase inhibitor YacG [Hyphomicrobium sp.]
MDKERPTGGECSVCGKSAVVAYRPFCSARCRDVDLARWLGGGYVIAGGSSEVADDAGLSEFTRGEINPGPEGGSRSRDDEGK